MSIGGPLKVQLPAYELPPKWIPLAERRCHPDYSTELRKFLPRPIRLIRARVTDALGFNIRGGKEHFCGIFISKVMPNTEAERVGLREGDMILSVNDISFENIEHSKAVKILKSNTDIYMILSYFPYSYSKTYEKVRGQASFSRQYQ